MLQEMQQFPQGSGSKNNKQGSKKMLISTVLTNSRFPSPCVTKAVLAQNIKELEGVGGEGVLPCFLSFLDLLSFLPSFLRSFRPCLLPSFLPFFIPSLLPSFLPCLPPLLPSFLPSFLPSLPSSLASFLPSPSSPP